MRRARDRAVASAKRLLEGRWGDLFERQREEIAVCPEALEGPREVRLCVDALGLAAELRQIHGLRRAHGEDARAGQRGEEEALHDGGRFCLMTRTRTRQRSRLLELLLEERERPGNAAVLHVEDLHRGDVDDEDDVIAQCVEGAQRVIRRIDAHDGRRFQCERNFV